MTILIDGRAFTAPTAGISNFLKDCLMAWAKLRPYDTFIVALPRPIHKTFSDAGLPDNVRIQERSNGLFHKLPNLLWLLLMMPILVRQYKADIYFSPVPCLPFFLPRGLKKIIVVHDVVNKEFQHTMQWKNILSNKLFYDQSIKNTDIIWTNSYYTKDKVKEYFPNCNCERIFTGCSVSRKLYRRLSLSEQEKEEVLKKYNINGSFILFVGSLEPRKNLSFLLSLMPQLYSKKRVQLVIVGGKGWRNSHIRDIVENEHFPQESTVFCGFVPNEDLVKLYNMAECFVSTSLNEGFGMPQLEALLCGCPIVTAHNSAMIEVAGGKEGAFTVEGYNPEKWINTIIDVVEHHPCVNQKQLEEYNWDTILENFLKRI